MKRFSFILIFSFFTIGIYCQDIPNSFVNFGIGLGQSSGGFGVKTVMGYRNSGLLLGLGYWGAGITGYKIGGQISIHHMYAEAGYGVVMVAQENDDPIYPITAWSMLIGGMIGLTFFYRSGSRLYI